jgi:predicted DNA-binding transcriptional regulator AlpA
MDILAAIARVALLSTDIVAWQRAQLAAAGQDPSQIADGPFRFLHLREVKDRCGLSKSSIYRGIAAGRFPAPNHCRSELIEVVAPQLHHLAALLESSGSVIDRADATRFMGKLQFDDARVISLTLRIELAVARKPCATC